MNRKDFCTEKAKEYFMRSNSKGELIHALDAEKLRAECEDKEELADAIAQLNAFISVEASTGGTMLNIPISLDDKTPLDKHVTSLEKELVRRGYDVAVRRNEYGIASRLIIEW